MVLARHSAVRNSVPCWADLAGRLRPGVLGPVLGGFGGTLTSSQLGSLLGGFGGSVSSADLGKLLGGFGAGLSSSQLGSLLGGFGGKLANVDLGSAAGRLEPSRSRVPSLARCWVPSALRPKLRSLHSRRCRRRLAVRC